MTSFSDPLTLLNDALAALRTEQWDSVAMMCDSDSLATFRRDIIGLVRASESIPTLTVEQYIAMDPSMPRDVAEYHVRLHNDSHANVRGYAGFSSAEEVERLSSAIVFSRWIRHQALPSRSTLLDPTRQHAVVTDQPLLASLEVQPLGFIDTGEPIAHVFYRRTYLPMPIDADESWWQELSEGEQRLHAELARSADISHVMVRRQQDGSWRFVASHRFFDLDRVSLEASDEQDPEILDG